MIESGFIGFVVVAQILVAAVQGLVQCHSSEKKNTKKNSVSHIDLKFFGSKFFESVLSDFNFQYLGATIIYQNSYSNSEVAEEFSNSIKILVELKKRERSHPSLSPKGHPRQKQAWGQLA